MPLARPALTGHPAFPRSISAVEILRDLEREIRANPTDFTEVLGNLFAAVVAGRSIDDPAGAPLADALEALGDAFSDIILATIPAAAA